MSGIRDVGFNSYSEYLQSDLWKSIRNKVLNAAKFKCCMCHQTATQVHHRSYNRENLLGINLKGLVALCGRCHYAIEFTDGKKNDLGKANRKLKVVLRERRKIKKKARIKSHPPQQPPRRMTNLTPQQKAKKLAKRKAKLEKRMRAAQLVREKIQQAWNEQQKATLNTESNFSN